VQVVALLVLLNVPATQVAQVRSALGEGWLLTNVPAAQSDQAAQPWALVAVLNCPPGQAEH